MSIQKEEELLEKHLVDLSRRACYRNAVTYSDFLNLNELNILNCIPRESLYTDYVTFGGYDFAERQMAAFLPEAFSLYAQKDASTIRQLFAGEVSVLRIAPRNKKYAEDLCHRDFLGAILSLGIDRGKTGDILTEDKSAAVFFERRMAEFAAENLARIRHTPVTASQEPLLDFHYEPRFEEIRGTVASVRLDSLLAVAFPASRSTLARLVESGKVFVNGRLAVSNACQVKEHDKISVRGMGKFEYAGVLSVTKKKRMYVSVRKYV